jgi:hypothetical protein
MSALREFKTTVPVTHLIVLALRDVHKNLRSWMLNVKQVQNGGTIIGYGSVLIGGYHFVHTAWS